MSLEDVQKQFAEELGRRAAARYIDRAEERAILRLALQQGVTVDSARAVLALVCEAQHYVLESRVVSQLTDYLDTAAGNDGKIDAKEYQDALTLSRKWTVGTCPDVQCKRLIVEIIQNNGYKTSRGWFSSWYDNLKREVGV
jgi:hypothetical protein